MRIMKAETGRAYVEWGNGEIRNSFEVVPLPRNLAVVVPSLVLLEDDETTPLFNITVGGPSLLPSMARIEAHCLSPTCQHQAAQGGTDRLAGQAFPVIEGRVLGDRHLPQDLAHKFGESALKMDEPLTLLIERTEHPTVGHIFRPT